MQKCATLGSFLQKLLSKEHIDVIMEFSNLVQVNKNTVMTTLFIYSLICILRSEFIWTVVLKSFICVSLLVKKNQFQVIPWSVLLFNVCNCFIDTDNTLLPQTLFRPIYGATGIKQPFYPLY